MKKRCVKVSILVLFYREAALSGGQSPTFDAFTFLTICVVFLCISAVVLCVFDSSVVLFLQVFNRFGLLDSGHPDHLQGTREHVCTLAGHPGETPFTPLH